MPPVKLTGDVLEKAALQRENMLVIYGSSELDHAAENRPDTFFRERPTGFTAFPIGRAGDTCLMMLVKLAAAGKAARGKKVVVMLSPSWFLRNADAGAVEANLRPLQLGLWVFGDELNHPLEQDIARRLLAYPGTLEREPLLGSAVAAQVQDSWEDRMRLSWLKPLGWTQNFLLKRLEFIDLLRDLPTRGPKQQRRQTAAHAGALPPPKSQPDWERLAVQAEAYDRAQGDASPFSVGTPERMDKGAGFVETAGGDGASREKDADFQRKLAQSDEWTDLGLLLRVLHAVGAQALVISQPFNGRYRDPGGSTPAGRRVYYDTLDKAVRAAGFEVRDFSEWEEDRTFFNDAGHPSAKAWIYYNRAMDKFYHEKPVSHWF